MNNLKKQFHEATEAISVAMKHRVAVCTELCEAFLKEKGIVPEQTVKVLDRYNKVHVGVFRIVENADLAVLRFFAYKKADATLSKQPKVFDFGEMPDLSWEPEVISVVPCEVPTQGITE